MSDSIPTLQKASEVSVLSVFLFETMINEFKLLPNHSGVFVEFTHPLRHSAVRPLPCQQQ